jgi:hypothetical protein
MDPIKALEKASRQATKQVRAWQLLTDVVKGNTFGFVNSEPGEQIKTIDECYAIASMFEARMDAVRMHEAALAQNQEVASENN